LNFEIIWHKQAILALNDVGKNNEFPVNIIAHEFFDALPSLKFKYENEMWHEMMIGLEPIEFH
jgi:SAM-dependent MidA family methyltransferase